MFDYAGWVRRARKQFNRYKNLSNEMSVKIFVAANPVQRDAVDSLFDREKRQKAMRHKP
jgi:hypothetical protein